MPRVSIIIPVYNGANYLEEAIRSALAQTQGDVEVIVVNDGSTDGGATAAVARGFEPAIRYIEKPNGGVSSALNTGLREMSGEYFCWLSHDDRFLPHKTERQLSFLDSHQGAKIVHCDFDIIDERGTVTSTWREPVDVIRDGRTLLDTWVYGCALMIHRSCFDATGGFNEANRTTQDLEMWLRLLERNEIHHLREVLCQVRMHEQQGSRTEARYTRDKDDLFGRVVARYEPAYFDPERAKSPRGRAEIYEWLAMNAARRQSFGGADAAVLRGWLEWPSIRNPLLFKRFLGMSAVLAVENAWLKSLNKVRWLRRKLGG